MTEPSGTSSASSKIYVTVQGLPLTIELAWPVFRSKTGADFYILHGTVRLADGSSLHALVALQVTLTVKEVVPSLEAKDIEAPVINTLRKAVDTKEIEFLKTPKRIPVQFSTRTWDVRRSRWSFLETSESEIERMLESKLYWQTKASGEGTRVWVVDPTDLQYAGANAEAVMAIARKLEGRGLLQLHGEEAVATSALIADAQRIEAATKQAEHELEQKHAFERG